MTAARAIFRVTIRQLLTKKRVAGFLLMALLPSLLQTLIPESSFEGPEQALLEVAIGTLLSLIIPITAIVLASSALGDERSDKTLSFVTLRPVSRYTIAAAKIAATAVAASSFAAAGAIALSVTYIVDGGTGNPTIGLVAAGILSAILYAVIVTPLGYVTKRATIAALSYLVLIDNLIIGAIPSLASSSPWRVGLAGGSDLLSDSFTSTTALDAIGSLEPSIGVALVQVVGTIAVMTAVLGLLLSRLDNA